MISIPELLEILRSRQLTSPDIVFFTNFLSTGKYLFIYEGETLLQILIRENKNITYIILLLNNLLKMDKHYHDIINHCNPNGLPALIDMIICRPKNVKDVIKIFMSFECFNKNIKYNGKTVEDYIKESSLEQKNKDKLLKTLNMIPNRKRKSEHDDIYLSEAITNLTKLAKYDNY